MSEEVGLDGAKIGAGRLENGRFAPGNRCSPGRKPKAVEQEYEAVFYETIPVARWRKIIEAQARRAEKGDIQAFNAIANRIMPIIERREHTGKDGAPIEIIEIFRDADGPGDNPLHDAA